MAEARHLRDEQGRRWHTWHAAALPNVQKFPTFDDFVAPVREAAKPQRRQTMEEQIAIARQWAAVAQRQARRPASPNPTEP